MKKLKLPTDYIEFMESKGVLEYAHEEIEPGLVGLTPMPNLELGEVWVNSDGSPNASDDPHAGDDGYYSVPAVSLTNKCDSYDPEFILLWMPHEECFGTWDCDHWDLFVFDNTSWLDIVENPAKYIEAQWADIDRDIGSHFKPYPKYKFKTGRPY